jgi:Mg-chelatase subunit ChlD
MIAATMVFHHPVWLLLAIPLGVSLLIWRIPRRQLLSLRVGVLILILLALAGFSIELPSRAGMVLVVADRSRSMPPGSDVTQKETIDLIQAAARGDQQLAVISFGETVALEQPPQSGKFAGFMNDVGGDASNLFDGIEKAVSLIPKGSPGRILLLSDGRWTGRDPAAGAARAAAHGIVIDYRSLQRSSVNDTAVSSVDAPSTVTPDESFVITAWIRSPAEQETAVELQRGGQAIASGKTKLAQGLNRLTFRDRAGAPGTQSYSLRIGEVVKDPVPENNTARFLIGVDGPRSIRFMGPTRNSGLARLLAAGGLDIKVVEPPQSPWTIEELSNYSALVLENVSANRIGESGMETIAAWVKESGAGLMLTGGKNSYGAGGYFRSPLESILPVSMELRREHRKLALAIVVAMDRSGSMAAPVGGGRIKMDLANLAAAQVLDLLSPMDEFGVVAVDSQAHIIANLAAGEDRKDVRRAILAISPLGGGIFIFEALAASSRLLLSAEASTRHIILLADAADSEEEGRYRELLEKCREANITVSVVGLGRETDRDAELLRDIATRGGGRCFFTDNAEDLPRLFAQDTIVVARSTFLEQATPVRFGGGILSLTSDSFVEASGGVPPIGGYNLCYLRPRATLAAASVDAYQAPVLAAWQAGSGRVLCYTGEADGAYTGDIAKWDRVGSLFGSLARWVSGEAVKLPPSMVVTQEVRNGVNLIQLHLDPESSAHDAPSHDQRKGMPLIRELPAVTTLSGSPGARPKVDKSIMRWTSPETLAVEIPIKGSDTSLSTVEVTGTGRITLAPVRLPYSSEFAPVEEDAGLFVLERLARATGGTERVELAGVWKDLRSQPRLVELSPWLLGFATLLLLLEVLERRTGLFSIRRSKPSAGISGRISPEEKTAEAGPSIVQALGRAARQARDRTGGKKQ